MSGRKGYLAPSILSADLTNFKEQILTVEKAGAEYLHVDIMDGHFVPNITFGSNIVRSLRKITKMPLDVHLMISRPEDFIDEFIEAGSDIVTVHYETVPHLHRMIERIKAKGAKAGVALNPHTPVSVLEEVLPMLDLALIMSVNPGFGGQKFIHASIDKVRRLKEMCVRRGATPLIEVDGGVNADNIEVLQNAGVDLFVAGSSVFGAADVAGTVEAFRKKMQG